MLPREDSLRVSFSGTYQLCHAQYQQVLIVMQLKLTKH